MMPAIHSMRFAGEALAQRLDDRDAAGDRGLEGHHHALLLRGGEDLVAVRGEQRLVGGDHVLAVRGSPRAPGPWPRCSRRSARPRSRLRLPRTTLEGVVRDRLPCSRRCSLARCSALSATTEMRIARPARRWISSALRLRTSQVPPPTVPMPSSPTLMGFMSLQPELRDDASRRATRAASTLYITVSRTLPSRRGQWWRMTPSFFAPSASIARCERKLKLSVRRPTTLHSTFSKANANSKSLQAVFTWLRWQRAAYQV